ncbi:hypothetical protein BMETH_1543_0 [methanotrophic bacterial endosymbiont of Bathymodiolus sp.]|nr:hypothetical protein BMETH_1543_0 [methanotrophic bacterial endosymbiont of Bathymodiolus sp.]
MWHFAARQFAACFGIITAAHNYWTIENTTKTAPLGLLPANKQGKSLKSMCYIPCLLKFLTSRYLFYVLK